ncbi:MAG TPA: DNA repair protein RecN [Chryseosolibacter sp.]|nr:DNA repair protein RecN [Chryseosolibacter sp.]
MLTHLTIKNYALIRHLELDPSNALNVITGETGAGKSIMLGALGLLMGNRADSKVLWDENEKCIIEGTYNIKGYKLKTFFKTNDLDYDDQTVIRREISPGGKSRAFINDTPVTLDILKHIGGMLMDIHSQHETLQLGNQSFQLHLIDTFAGNELIKESYAEAWKKYQENKNAFESLSREAATLRADADYVKFQLDELQKAALVEDEQSGLESELRVMEHAEEIKSRFNIVLDLMTRSELNARNLIGDVKHELHQLSNYAPAYETLLKRLESVRIELNDVADEIENEESKVEFDPERTEFVKERLSNIYRLQKKHRVNSVKELIEIENSLHQKNNVTSNLDELLALAEKNLKMAEKKLFDSANALSETRKKEFEPICKQLVKLLKDLGIPEATLQVDKQVIQPTSSGQDKIDILFSANKGIAPRPLAQVASGGEFSRLMFSIKFMMAAKTAMPTLVLDEIDNGVSGEIALQLGSMMQNMSRNHQVITISHLPQIAARGDRHYYVFKDNSSEKTISNIRMLNETERVEEIAKMIGGAKPSRIALENAQELLAR